jgi:ribose transport system ATP-binding protein
MSTARTVLKLTGVRKAFGGVAALKGVSFDVRAGEVHALLGENGAGKSTLMAIAAGSLEPDAGTVEIDGDELTTPSPSAAQALGVGVVYQRPAVANDLTVLENMALAMPAGRRPSGSRALNWAQERLDAIGAAIDPLRRAAELTAAEHQLVEIAKALALDPKVLILDEPTAALSAAEIDHLFKQVRAIREAGTAVVYISHRIPEVTEISDRLTVLRDGENRGTFPIAEVSEQDILNLIVGRELEAMFPDKLGEDGGETLLDVRKVSGESFDEVSFSVRSGEIVGLAGVVGNGQQELMRAIAGLEAVQSGEIELRGEVADVGNPVRAQKHGVHYVPADRHREGLFESLNVRENSAANALDRFTQMGFVRRAEEERAVDAEMAKLAVRASSPEAGVTTLSGGNQQKVVFARALLGEPQVLLCDEPTQGVDVGARAEIYRLLRSLADDGKAIVVCSSDAQELEGLCDRVVIMSRGSAVADLKGGDVTEERITGAAVTATGHRRERGERRETGGEAARTRLNRFLRGDNVAVPVIGAVILALALYTYSQNADFTSSFNVQSILLLSTALMLVSIGQLIVLLTGGIDLSVGPMMGLGLVIVTTFMTEERGGGGILLGLAVLIGAGIVLGLLNGSLVRFARISPVIATLATFIAVQGVALKINPIPEGLLSPDIFEQLSKSVGDAIPYAFIVVFAVAIGCELLLRRGRFGRSLRAVGSDETAAHRIGVRVTPTVLAAYVLCAVFAGLAAIMLAVQIGTGDAQAGQQYTLQSIAAVAIGGASIYGGRGSVIGAVLGAILLTEVINALPFLDLGEAWLYWLPGGIVLVGAAIYARASGAKIAAVEAEAAT